MKKLEVLNYFRGVKNTALALGISHPAVSRWDSVIPEKQALRLDRMTQGKLSYNPAFYLRKRFRRNYYN